MKKKVFGHLILALIFFTTTLGQQYLFYYLAQIPIIWMPLVKYFGIFCFFFAGTFIGPQKIRYFFLSFIFLLNYFQMAHLSYFGTQILPGEILLLFTQIHEIMGTVAVEKHHILLPLFLTLLPAVVGYLSLKRITDLYLTKWMGLLFILYLIYNPVRTFVTGNTWGRQPSTRELGGMNLYLSLSYFSGKLLPHKFFKKSSQIKPNSSTELKLTDGFESDWDNIIFILGESLTPHHMSLYGYELPTTPYLLSQKDDQNFYHTIGLSGGVSTDISVAFLMNMGFGDAGGMKAAKGDHCLFRLAKKKNFRTHFLSAQSSQQLRYISPYLCASQLDQYKSLENISPETLNDQAADDRVLLKEVKKVLDQKNRHFIVLHQRGSHGPWELRSHEKNRRFPHDNKVNHYNNSVVEFDLFFEELSKMLSDLKQKTLVIYVSDHGEAMGQEGKWGHGQLIRPAFEIPFIIKSFQKDLPEDIKRIPKHFTHYNTTLLLIRELGFKPNHSIHILPKDYMIYGNDIDGFAGKAEISFKSDNTYDFKVID
jgi:glucan phosphoethanolaminetransferase (alkaline phosphatase superfamily)